MIHRILSVRNGPHFENMVFLKRDIILQEVTEWSFRLTHIGKDTSFQDDFRMGRHLQIDGFTPDQFQRFPAKGTGQPEFIEAILIGCGDVAAGRLALVSSNCAMRSAAPAARCKSPASSDRKPVELATRKA